MASQTNYAPDDILEFHGGKVCAQSNTDPRDTKSFSSNWFYWVMIIRNLLNLIGIDYIGKYFVNFF
jgi:hypothetical protein